MPHETQSRPGHLFLDAAIVVKGKASSLEVFIDEAQEAAGRLGLVVVYVKASGSRLWIREGDGP